FEGELITVRQCVFTEDENGTLCDLEHDRLSTLNYTLEYCKLCKSDLCNTSGTSYSISRIMWCTIVIINMCKIMNLYS
ncbi:hypothetical protein L9F63_013062, partial [Diploptera punctata]